VSKGQTNDGKKQSQGKRDLGCFICGGLQARECSKKERLGALGIQGDQEDEEGEPFARVNPLKMRLNVLRSLAPDEKVPPCYVQVVDAPQEKGTSWEGSLTASRDKQGLEQRQELKKTVAQEVGQNVETSGQAEDKLELPQNAWRKDWVRAPECSSTGSTRTSNSRGVGGLSQP
jgi:hypothetical protein